MREPPFYPAWLVNLGSWGRRRLGDARFERSGWVLHFNEGALRISEPGGVNVIQFSTDDTEALVDLIHALDAGRYTFSDFVLRHTADPVGSRKDAAGWEGLAGGS